MPLSSDVTILNKYCSVTHAAVTPIPKVKASAGNTKIMVSSLGNWVNSRLSCSKTFGYCILQIAYSSAVMWNSVKKHAGFAWWRVKCKMWRGRRRTAAFVSAAGWLQVVAPRGWRRWSWCVGSWTPLLLHLKQKKVTKAFVLVCRHGGRRNNPWEGDVTVGSMSNMKEGEVAAREKNNPVQRAAMEENSPLSYLAPVGVGQHHHVRSFNVYWTFVDLFFVLPQQVISLSKQFLLFTI